MPEALTVGSLFAGIGGLELGLEMTGGFRTVWQVECDEYANRVLEKHWPDVRRWGDVATFPPDADQYAKLQSDSEAKQPRQQAPRRRNLDGLGEADWRCDLITAGFPCQDISYAGKGAGLGGERSGLFYEAARVIRTLGPRYVVLENVSALLTRGLDAVLGTLASLGYDCEWHCLPAGAVGAPHIRDRVFVIAYADDARGDAPGCRIDGLREAEKDTQQPEPLTKPCGHCGWSTEPDVGRVAHGVPARVDRLRCLGNAVVPQVAYQIGQRILSHERCCDEY